VELGSLLVIGSAACTDSQPDTVATEPSVLSTAQNSADTAEQPSNREEHVQLQLGHFPEPADQPLPEHTTRKLQSALDAALQRVPGVSAAVLVADRGTWSGAAGTADGINPLTSDAQFGIASITKTVVATEIMRLAEQGLLGLDDPVSQYLSGDLGFDTNGATIRNLLAMESGIPEPGIFDSPEVESDPHREWQVREMLADVPARRTDPGQRHVYSNTSYMLLGLVIESVTGQEVSGALRAYVTADPRLASLVYQPAERPEGPHALPFISDEPRPGILEAGGGYLPSLAAVSSAGAAGGMASDASALAQWGYAMFGGKLISERSLRTMTDFNSDDYGLGVYDLTDYFADLDDVVIGNGGWEAGGYSSMLAVIPGKGTVIAVLANRAGDPRELVLPVVRELASHL
jgi:D-alanyl-D-alanine carboxypeptidase